MARFKDYYKVLRLDPSAEIEVIEAAFRKLSRKYHPDVNKDPDAEEKYKEITEAYFVLKDPIKRKKYDEEYHKFKGSDQASKDTVIEKPKPTVDKSYILFNDVTPGEIKTDYFIINNTGGDYENVYVEVQTPNSWLKITGINSLDPNQSDELPLRVELEANADEWGRNYTEYIVVKLDGEEIKIRVELNTKIRTWKQSSFNKKILIPIIVLTLLFLIFFPIGVYYSSNQSSKQEGESISQETTVSNSTVQEDASDEETAEMKTTLTYPEDINFPNYTGYINDYVGLLDYDSKSKLEALTSKIERETGSEIAVAIVESLQGITIEEYAARLFEKWGIGKEKQDNGILIIICTEGEVGNRPLRIEVGYGLEGVISDFEARLIIDETIVPNFGEGNFYEGLYNAIIIIANEIYEEEGLEPIGSAEDGLIKIIVLNGEGTARIATSVTNILDDYFNSVEETVVMLEPRSADNFNYTQTKITVSTSQEGINEIAQKIQERLGVGVIEYSDNNVDNVDISIIIGSDYTK